MSQAKVFVTRQLPQGTAERLAEYCQLEVWEDFLPPLMTSLHQKIKGLDALLCLLTDRVDAELINAAPRLKVISNMAVGYDNINVAAASRRRIPVGNTPGVLTETTADFAFALLMSVARRIPEAQAYIQAGHWKTWHPTCCPGRTSMARRWALLDLGALDRRWRGGRVDSACGFWCIAAATTRQSAR